MQNKQTLVARLLRVFLVVGMGLMLAPRPTVAQNNGQRFFALAAPFPTITDNVSFAAIKAAWQGDVYALQTFFPSKDLTALVVAKQDVAALSTVLGEPKASGYVQILDTKNYNDVVVQLWTIRGKRGTPSVALLPFDQLDARLKLLQVDGINLFEKDANVGGYPIKTNGNTNRDPNQMTVVAMTGVTAMVRGTAVMMEKKGVTYPGEKIRDWLTTADIAHISNEVSFREGCPKPSFNSGVVMCSDPKYIELLKYVGTDVIDLTGNHLWDYGSEHLSTTLKIYEDLGWQYFGGGRNAATALNPVKYDNINGNKIAFVGCNWFGADWATATKPGSARCGATNPKKLDLIVPLIQQLTQEGYLVIATIQYLELYDYAPSAQQVQDFNALREAGAVVVNGSQGHHAQGFSVNDKGFAHYGVGNFFFGDQAGIGTHQSFVDRHVFYNGKYLGVDLRTAYIQDNSQPVPMNAKDRAALLQKLFQVSGY